MKNCSDCSKPICNTAKRCKTCSNLLLWKNPNDGRRKQLEDRNSLVRGDNFPYKDREWLRERYEDKQMSLRQIAKEGHCGLRTIARWMKTHKIPTRTSVEGMELVDRTGANNTRWRGGIQLICPTCNKTKSFSAKQCHDCRKKTIRGANSTRWRGGIQHICPTCGETKSNGAKQCGNCRKKTIVGSQNPNYRGIADIMVLVRHWSFTNWRPLIFERDKYTCQNCGDNHGHNLNAHHIKPFSTIVREIYKLLNPILDTPEQRIAFAVLLTSNSEITNLENGITLCKTCHNLAHKVLKYRHTFPRRKQSKSRST